MAALQNANSEAAPVEPAPAPPTPYSAPARTGWQPVAAQPVSPQPVAPQSATQPATPHSVAPQPIVPQTVDTQPVSPQLVVRQSISQRPRVAQPIQQPVAQPIQQPVAQPIQQPVQPLPLYTRPATPEAAPQWPVGPAASGTAWHPVAAPQPVAQQPVAFQQPGAYQQPVAYHQPIEPPPAFGGTGYSHYQYEAPEPKKRRPWIGILVTLGLFALVGIVGVTAFSGVRDWFSHTFSVAEVPDFDGPGDEPVLVTIPSGASGTMMGELLYEAGVVASTEAFRHAFQANPRANSIQAGTYELQKHMNAAQAVQAMLDNGTITFRLVIPEGFTKSQVFARIEAVTGITQEEIDAALADPAALGLPEVAQGNPEGWLFPATYQIQPGQDATSILRTLIARTRQELMNQGADPEQWETILNKAALVEREVRDPADRPKVARAIQNRLDRGMALQIDAAVAYGLGISGTQLTLAHLADASNPFNTYQHLGLPPTPIANPGGAAIAAVLNPAEGNYIFWVTINLATGETVFTDTYADHQRYVAQLREWQAANPGFGQQSDTGANQTD